MSNNTDERVWPDHIDHTVPGYQCTACEHLTDTEGDTPLYECGDDGVFIGEEGNRCPSCNKFGTRVGNACEECDEGPVEEAQVFHCAICDAFFEDGDQTDHVHDDDEGDGDAAKTRRAKSTWAVPVLLPVRAAEVPADALVALDWPVDTPGAEGAASGAKPPYRYRTASRVEVRDGTAYIYEAGGRTVMTVADFPADARVQVVTGWDRPTGAYDIAARDLRLSHLVCTDPDDWTARRSFVEIARDLAADTVTGTGRHVEPVTYSGDQVLTVVDGNTLFGKPGWRVEWDRPFPRKDTLTDNMLSVPNPDYDPALHQALEDAGIDADKVALRAYAHHPADRLYMRYVGKRPELAHRFIEILREFGYTPTVLAEVEMRRY